MNSSPERVFAIDWSGDKKNFKKKVWLAEVGPEGLGTFRNEWTREELIGFLIKEGKDNPRLVVGFDFSFSFPSWFIRDQGCAAAPDFWEHVQLRGEEWLSRGAVVDPFFTKGKWPGGSERPAFRATEQELQKQGHNPETVFRLVGQKQVGPGSIRGMPALLALREAGFKIWPFDPPGMPLVVEIYPRLFYGKVAKNRLEARVEHLEKYSGLDKMQRIKASCSDDAFDSLVSGFEMFRRRKEFASLSPTVADSSGIEGQIWS